MTPSWNRFSGACIDSKYTLETHLGGSESSAFFQTAYGLKSVRAVIKLIVADESAAEPQLSLWRRTARLSHPNLLPLLDCGRADDIGIDGSDAREVLLYAVFEYPDDNLALALENGPLPETQIKDVLRSVLGALRYVHSERLVLGTLDPAHVVAVGTSIKLATDNLRYPGAGLSPAVDVLALGNMLHELLGNPDLARVAEPLRSVILHCTDPDVNRRWPLERIATLVRTPAEPPPAPPVVLTPQVTAAKSPRVPRWVYAALGIPVVALIFAAMPRSVSPVEPRVEATSVEPPRASVAAPVPKAVERPEAPVAPKSGKMWRVIAYAYSGQRPAAGKAKTINEKWPSFRAEVFTPKGRGRPPFLIAIGGRMTRQEALRLQKTARASGLPHDTYIQNYSD